MRYSIQILLAAALFLFVAPLGSGKSSKLVMSWKNPHLSAMKSHHVLALGLSDKTGIRADFEDALAARLTGMGLDTIPGHSILLRPEGAQLDLEYLKTQLRENQIDAVVVSRLIKVENTITHVPGTYITPFPYYNSFYGYYGTVYPVVYTPDYLREDKKVRIETNVYTITSQEGELVWTGVTDTLNPSNMHKSINGLVKLVTERMQRDGAL